MLAFAHSHVVENRWRMGGDRACQLAVELAWLLGSWDATWKELQTEAEEQCARSMVEWSSRIFAEAYKIDKQTKRYKISYY